MIRTETQKLNDWIRMWQWSYVALKSFEDTESPSEGSYDALWDLDTDKPVQEATDALEKHYGCTTEDIEELGVIQLATTVKIASMIGEC